MRLQAAQRQSWTISSFFRRVPRGVDGFRQRRGVTGRSSVTDQEADMAHDAVTHRAKAGKIYEQAFLEQ